MNDIQKPVPGVYFLVPAFLIWGGSPVYWKALAHVPSLELLAHRIVWSFLFLMVLVVFQKRLNEIIEALTNRATLLVLAGTTLILAFNWFLFIWAVNHEQVLQTSLGYYIAPLINVLLGMIILKERLRLLQSAALLIAGSGVLYYAFGLGQFPWISISLALSFGLYGLLHKMMAAGSVVGLCIETMMLSIPSAAYLFWMNFKGEGALFSIGPTTDILLFGTNLVTALPLLLFTLGARRAMLSTVGFMQYISPCCTFLLAVFIYREPFSVERLVTFVLIWTAVTLFSADSLYSLRKT